MSRATSVVFRVPAGVTSKTITRWVRAARQLLPPHAGLVTITVIGPAAMRQLNRHWRRRDHPTNVLSFILDQPPVPTRVNGERVWGELFLCPNIIRREATTWQRTYRQHFRALVEHGLLHLYGLDHATDRDRRRWQRYERRLEHS